MITPQVAEDIILNTVASFGTISIPLENANGYVLAEPIYADRDMPPFNRATMDGIAISYSAELTSFKIIATQAAGDSHIAISAPDKCIEIMTGAALHPSLDTIIPYEEIDISNNIAQVKSVRIKQGQNIHKVGVDAHKGDLLLSSDTLVTPISISILASVGKDRVLVKKLPRIIIISTGNELVDVNQSPNPFQIRKSNSYTIHASLQSFGIDATCLHVADDPAIIKAKLLPCLEDYDAILLTGAVSKGKYDYIPKVLDEIGLTKHFQHVRQRPGKPFLFGTFQNKCVVFGFPGNPVSSFFCLHRYCIPWLKKSMGLQSNKPVSAILSTTIHFDPPLEYYIPVKLSLNETAQLLATPFGGNGSGDFSNLKHTHAFMELPAEQNTFTAGMTFRIWPYASFL